MAADRTAITGRSVGPHCTVAIGLDPEELGAAMAAAHPFDAICAQVSSVEIVDSMTGEIVQGRVV